MLGMYRKSNNGLYVLRKEDIDNEAENILRKYCPDCLLDSKEIDIEKLIEDIGLSLCYAKMSKNSEILGAFVFNKGRIPVYIDDEKKSNLYDEKTIIIDSTIAESDDIRLRFTYGHELGHYVTQFELFHISNNQLSLFDNGSSSCDAVICKRENVTTNTLVNGRKSLETMEDWPEWQANYFSSAILIPKSSLKIVLKPYLDNYDTLEQDMPLDNLNFFERDVLILKLSNLYNVSKEMVINRLKSLNYLS